MTWQETGKHIYQLNSEVKIITQVSLNSLNLLSKSNYMYLGRIIPNKYKHRLEAKIRLNRAYWDNIM